MTNDDWFKIFCVIGFLIAWSDEMDIEKMFDRETVNKIKIDSNKMDIAFNEKNVPGKDASLICLIEEGMIAVVGEKNGELVYSATDLGREQVKQMKAQ